MSKKTKSKPQKAPSLPTSAEEEYLLYNEQDEDGAFVAEMPALPSCISEGNTRAKAVENVKEAIAVYLESLEAHGEPIPSAITEELEIAG